MLVANLIYHGSDSSQLPSRICLIPYVRQAGHTGVRRANGLGWWRELRINSHGMAKSAEPEKGNSTVDVFFTVLSPANCSLCYPTTTTTTGWQLPVTIGLLSCSDDSHHPPPPERPSLFSCLLFAADYHAANLAAALVW